MKHTRSGLAVAAVMVSIALLGCGEPATSDPASQPLEAAPSPTPPSADTSIVSKSSGSTAPLATAAAVATKQDLIDPGWLLAGQPLATYDIFEPIESAADLVARTDLTVAATLTGFELNPGYEPGKESSDDPGIYVQGYAGPAGVLRLFFRPSEVVGGNDAGAPVEAVGRPGEIAVDLEYWALEGFHDEHLAQVQRIADEQHTFVLVLEQGTIDGRATGAYRLWLVHDALAAVGQDGLVHRVVSPTIDYVAADAIARGEDLPEPTPVPTHSPEDDHGEDAPRITSDILTPGLDQPLDEYLAFLRGE